jgi:hypothetical protein
MAMVMAERFMGTPLQARDLVATRVMSLGFCVLPRA